MQGLGGLAPGLNRGATMSGNKGGTDSGTHGVKLMRTAGATTVTGTFTAPSAGLYRIALWGAGAVDSSGGGAGGLAVRTLRLFKDEQLPYVIAPNDDTGVASAITFRDSTMTANSATTTAGGTATGGDVNQTGGVGAATVGGTAPSYDGMTGGTAALTPGGGANHPASIPGSGMLIITKIAD